MQNKLTTIIPNRKKAIFFAKRQLAEFVYDAVQLEGINYTLPQIQTLLDGVTVGGHSISDQKITLNQKAAWGFLLTSLENNKFSLDKAFVCQLHNLAARDDALEWGVFRTGQVTIAGTSYLPPKAQALDGLWQSLDMNYHQMDVEMLYQQAIGLFLDMARMQFFYDVNKRMGRFMMNGILLDCGYPAINLPAKRQETFNQLMLDFYQSNDKSAMINFMISCLDQQLIEIMSEA